MVLIERVQKIENHGAIGVAIDRNNWAVLMFKEVWANDPSAPKALSNSQSYWMHWIL